MYKMKFPAVRFPLLAGLALFTLFLTATLLLLWQGKPLDLETWLVSDLKDLTPELSPNAEVNNIIDTLSSAVENRMLFVLHGQEPDELAEAAGKMAALFEEHPDLFHTLDPTEVVTGVLDQLTQHRFHLLTTEQQALLNSADDATIVQTAVRDLYGGGASLFPITQDPLNFYTQYLLSLQQNSGLESGCHVDGDCHQIVVVDILGKTLELNSQQQVAQIIDRIEASARAEFPNTDILHSGIFFFAADAASSAQAEISVISTLSSLGVIVMIGIAFRSLFALIMPALSIALGMGLALLFSVVIFDSIHVFTLLFGASLVGVVMDYSLHYLYHHRAATQQTGLTTAQAQRQSTFYKAMLLSLLTSVIGYSALGFADLVSLQRVAIFSCVGLIGSWLAVIWLAPLLSPKKLLPGKWLFPAMSKGLQGLVSRYMARYARLWLLLVFVVSPLSLLLLKVSDRPDTFFSISPTLLANETAMAQYLNDYEPGSFVLIKGQNENSVRHEYEQLLTDFPERNATGFSNFSSIFSWYPTTVQQRNNYELNNRVYRSDGLAQQFFNTVGATPGSYEQLAQDYRASANQRLTAADISRYLTGVLPPLWFELPQSDYAIVRIAKGLDLTALQRYAESKPAQMTFVNTREMAQTSLAAQRLQASWQLLIAYALVMILLCIHYGIRSGTQLVLIPLAASLCTLSLFAVLGIAITLFHVMALFLVLGLGMDYMIFMQDMTETGEEAEQTMQGILLSTLTTLCSFGLLGFSSMVVVAGFGMTMLVGSAFNLLFAIALLKWRQRAF
jgi:predicted exporter